MMYYGICKSKEYKESMLLGKLELSIKIIGKGGYAVHYIKKWK